MGIELFQTIRKPATSTPTSTVKTHPVLEEGINNAVAMTIENVDLHEVND